jgi:hypothetical protein
VRAKAANRNAPLALSWLKAANADLRLRLALIAPHKLDQAILNVALHEGVLKART